MTRSSVRGRLRAWAFSAFYSLPPKWRRVLVRLGTQKYIVGAVVLVRDSRAPAPGRLLLLRQPSFVGWSLPAGLLRRGEAPADGAARELAEETGLRVEPDSLRPAVPSAVVHHRGRWVDVVFETSCPADQASLRIDGAEIVAADWHRLDALPPLTVATARLLSHYGIGPYLDYPEARHG